MGWFMRLLILRHGIADHPGWTGPDTERPLNQEGVESMQKGARRLAKLGIEPGLILYSPLLRCKQTAEMVAAALDAGDRLKVDNRLEPGFSVGALLELVRENSAASELMFVCHSPDCDEVVRALVGGVSLHLGKGAVAAVDLDQATVARPVGRLKWLATRKLLTK